MRTTTASVLLLAAASALLLAAPAAAMRSLKQDPAPAPQLTVDVNVTVSGADCSAVQKKVDATISAWIKNVVVLVQVTKDPSACTADGGTAVVSVHASITIPSLGGLDINMIIDQVKQAIGPTVNLKQLAIKNKDFNKLATWAKKKGYKIKSVGYNVLSA